MRGATIKITGNKLIKKQWRSTLRRRLDVWLEEMRNNTKMSFRGTRWRSWLMHYATSRKVAGSIPDVLTGHNTSEFTLVIVTAHSLTERSIRHISRREGGKRGRCIRLPVLPTSCVDCLKIWEPQLSGTLWACNRPVIE